MSSVKDTKNEESLDFNTIFLILKKQYAIKNQEDLAGRLGIQPQAISNAKKARRMPQKWILQLAQKNFIPWDKVIEIMKTAGPTAPEKAPVEKPPTRVGYYRKAGSYVSS